MKRNYVDFMLATIMCVAFLNSFAYSFIVYEKRILDFKSFLLLVRITSVLLRNKLTILGIFLMVNDYCVVNYKSTKAR